MPFFPLHQCPILLPTIFLCALLAGCGAKVIRVPPPPVSPPQTTPSSPPIKTGKIPPTQRPYQIDGKTYYPLPSAEGFSETGLASWYGAPFHGRKTSNGETYNMYDWTAAHKTLPMHTRLLVENLENGKSATVRINDRGPFVRGRVIDLSYNVARNLDIVKNGTAQVRITALGEAETIRLADGSSATSFLPHADLRAGEFFVQIGSFANEDNARRLAERMKSQGRAAEIEIYDRGDQRFYRVQVKAGSGLDEAKQVEVALTGAGFPDAFVVAR